VNVALVHDWLVDAGPEERCLEALCELFPKAPVYTLFYRPDRLPAAIAAMDIRASGLQGWPGITTRYAYYMPLFPATIECFDLRGYDLVLSNSRLLAKGVLTQPETCHISLLHPAVLTLWNQAETGSSPHGTRLFSRLYPFLVNYYRFWDIVASQRVDFFIAASEPLVHHIQKYYRRSDVLLLDPSRDRPAFQSAVYDWCCRLAADVQAHQRSLLRAFDKNIH
jgi:hypothetical protein